MLDAWRAGVDAVNVDAFRRRRERLRPAHTPDELADLYAAPHEHFGNLDHRLRVNISIQVAKALTGAVESAADLSCGDGSILAAVAARKRYWGDFAPGWQHVGPIDETITAIPSVDLFICCETVEHLDDPDTTLKAIRDKTTHLLLSTPVGCFHDTNPEHYWAWSREGVEEMLAAARFEPAVYVELDLTAAGPDHYCFGIFGCH